MVALTQTIVLPSELHRTHRHPAADSRSAALRWQASIGACTSNARRAARKIQLVASFSIPTTRPQARAAAGRSAAASGKVAVVLVDHGSRRTEANAMLETFADLYRSTSQRSIVKTAHMELAQPDIAAAIADCATEGASKVIIAPYFLSRGRHITEDIPALVEAAAAGHPGLQCVVADPLGIDELLAKLIEKRVHEAES